MSCKASPLQHRLLACSVRPFASVLVVVLLSAVKADADKFVTCVGSLSFSFPSCARSCARCLFRLCGCSVSRETSSSRLFVVAQALCQKLLTCGVVSLPGKGPEEQRTIKLRLLSLAFGLGLLHEICPGTYGTYGGLLGYALV